MHGKIKGDGTSASLTRCLHFSSRGTKGTFRVPCAMQVRGLAKDFACRLRQATLIRDDPAYSGK